MKHLFSNKQIYTQFIILVTSNILITGISLIIYFNLSINTLNRNLLDIVNRQKQLISILIEDGKSSTDIIADLKRLNTIGNEGEFTVANLEGDTIVFLLAEQTHKKNRIALSENLATPMRLALTGLTGFTKGTDYAGRKVFAAYTFMPSLRWGIVAKIPTSEIYHSYFWVIIVASIVSFILIFIWVFLFAKASDSIFYKIANSEEYYRSLFENNHICMLLIHPQTLQIIDANWAACNFYGYSHQTLTSLSYSEINLLPVDEIKQHYQQIRNENSKALVLKHQLADGEIRDVEVLKGLIKINQEWLVYTIIYDITERLNIERKLIESEETYRALFESINDSILVSKVYDNNQLSHFIEVNDIACERLEYSREELLTMSTTDINTEESKKLRGPIVEELLKNKQGIFEIEHITKSGKIIPVEISSRVLDYKDSKIIISVGRDISERKLMAEKLLQSNTLMRNTQSLAKIGGWEWNFKENLMYWTDETYQIHDIQKDDTEFTAQQLLELSQQCYHPDDQQTIIKAFHNCATKGIPFDMELPFTSVKGRHLWIRTVAQPIWQDEKIVKVVGSIADITDRKTTELTLKEKSDEIEAQNEEYKLINNELLEAKAKAEENDRLKTAFLQNMSHEIRTPMNAIMGFSELLPANFDNKNKLEQFSKIINQRCGDLLHIINEVLDIAKIESGQLTLYVNQFNLNDLFKEIDLFFTEHRRKLNKQHIDFKIAKEYLEKDNSIITDKVKLKQILINLISNAFKFTDEGQIIAGCKYDENQKLLFYVSDTGIGIPKTEHDYIFQRFTQLHERNKTNYGGTGLGLSIVKGLIELLDGKIWVESAPGQGATFYFTLSYNQHAVTEEKNNLYTNDPFNFKGKTALVVEDDPFNAEYLHEILSTAGFKTVFSKNGFDAIQQSNQHNFDIILMDINLPDITGYEASKKILQKKPTQKIIAQTAYASPTDKQKAIEYGCIDYLSKPMIKNELLYLLYKHLMLN